MSDTPPQTTPMSPEEVATLRNIETLSSLAQDGVFVGKHPSKSGTLIAFKIQMTPVSEVAAEQLQSSSSYELLASSAHTRPMIEGEKNRIHHSLWRQGSVIRSIFLLDYIPWNMALTPELDESGGVILRHRPLTGEENTASGGRVQYNTAYYSPGSMNWRCLIKASDLGCDAVGIIARSTSRGKFVPRTSGDDDRMAYSMFLVKFPSGTNKVPRLMYFPSGNIYDTASICSPVLAGATGYGPAPDGIFSDFENCPGNFDLARDMAKEIVGKVSMEEAPEGGGYMPYVRVTIPYGRLPTTSVELPPLWSLDDLKHLFQC